MHVQMIKGDDNRMYFVNNDQIVAYMIVGTRAWRTHLELYDMNNKNYALGIYERLTCD